MSGQTGRAAPRAGRRPAGGSSRPRRRRRAGGRGCGSRLRIGCGRRCPACPAARSQCGCDGRSPPAPVGDLRSGPRCSSFEPGQQQLDPTPLLVRQRLSTPRGPVTSWWNQRGSTRRAPHVRRNRSRWLTSEDADVSAPTLCCSRQPVRWRCQSEARAIRCAPELSPLERTGRDEDLVSPHLLLVTIDEQPRLARGRASRTRADGWRCPAATIRTAPPGLLSRSCLPRSDAGRGSPQRVGPCRRAPPPLRASAQAPPVEVLPRVGVVVRSVRPMAPSMRRPATRNCSKSASRSGPAPTAYPA